jgi:REP element-mobilizing transposase RayT
MGISPQRIDVVTIGKKRIVAPEARLKVARRFNGGTTKDLEESPGGTAERVQSSAMRLPHTYTSLLVHCVFSTKDRRPLISEEMQPRVWAFIGGIARKNRMKALAVGGVENHAHVLLSIPPTITVAKAMQFVKGDSSKWLNEQPRSRRFAWQENYSAFTIGVSQIPATVRYINNQKQHHKKFSFDEELKRFLGRHGIKPVDE